MPSTKYNNQEVDAYSDSGSTISLASCGSGESGFAPKPPLDGFTRSKSVKGRRSKVTQSPSPYASRQVTAKRREAVNTRTRNLWLTSMKNGHGALSTNNTAMNTWAGPRPMHAKKQRPGSRTRNFSDVVEFSSPKTKSHSRSATLSNTEPQIGGGGGGPALKPAEDYYDEVIELKKIINSLKEDNNLLSTKLHRVEEENMIKDRKMDDLLNARKQPEDFRRTLTDKRGDTSSIVNSLKQKLHGVERTVKDKEAELSKLRRELKMTDIEELRIQSETYYQEVQRLQLAILQMQQERINYTSSLTDLNKSEVMASARGKRPMSASQHRLLKDIEMLQAENRSLKKELISAVENQSKKGNKKSINVDYADMSRAQLLHTILDLEMRLDEPRERTKDSMTEKEEKVEKKGSKKRKSQESEEKLSHLEYTEGELKEERDKLRQTIERLKEDRTHYRNVADDLRKQLKAKEEEVEKLHHRLSQTTVAATVTAGGTGGAASGSVTRRKSSTASTASQSSSKGQSITARERDQQMEKEFEEFKQRHAAKVLQKQWRSYQGQKQEQLTKEEEKLKQEKAAKTLQREWKKHLKQKERASQDEAITDIQAAFRGHLARKDRLDRFHSDSVDSDDAIICVQSAMRGHLTRSTNRRNPEDDWSGDKSSIRAGHELLDDDEEEEEEEEDIVISRSTSYDKSPFSSKKHSRFTASTASPSLYPTHPTPRTRSSPHPAPRSLITLNTTPPSPAPRHRERRQEVKPSETLLDSSDDSDDDNVVIGGSSRATQTKQTNKQHPQPENKPESKGETTESSCSALMDVDLPREQGVSKSDSDSDNDLVVFGKTATTKESAESRQNKQEKHNTSVLSGEITESSLATKKTSIPLPNEIADSSSANKKPGFYLSNEMTESSQTSEKPFTSLLNENKVSLTNKKPSLLATNEMTSKSSANKGTPTFSLANENPYIGLTSGKQPNPPRLARNKFFSGIEWSKTDSTQKHKTNESKHDDNNNSNNEDKSEAMKKKRDQEMALLKDDGSSDEANICDQTRSHDQTMSPETSSLDSSLSIDHRITHDLITWHKPSELGDLTLTNEDVASNEHTTSHDQMILDDKLVSCDQVVSSDDLTTKKEESRESSKSKKTEPSDNDKQRKDDKQNTPGMRSGLTKNINPQRTIVEVSEESDNQLVTSAHRSQKKRNSHQTARSSISSDMKRERNGHEIIDSSDDDDVDEDDDDDLVMSHAKERTSSSSTSWKSSHDKSVRRNRPIRNQTSGKTRKTSSKELHDSNEESDDDAVVVTSRKQTESKLKEISNPRSSFSKTSLSKKESLGDLRLHNPKRTLRTSEDVRTTGRSLVYDDDDNNDDDDDDDDDDNDIVIGSWRKKQAKGDSSLKNDSLSSLWSDSSKQKKKSSSGFGFGSFEKVSSFRKHNSGLDELF